MLQLLGDVLVLPFSQVGNEDPGIERASGGSHPQLLNSFLLEIQEANVIILISRPTNNAFGRCRVTVIREGCSMSRFEVGFIELLNVT